MKITASRFLAFSWSLAVLALGASPLARANERTAPRAKLLSEGYVPVGNIKAADPAFPYSAHSLPWPIEFQDDSHTLGNVMAQYQPFGKPYFHGGIDIRTVGGKMTRTPVAGRLEAGHYSYSTNDDGSMEKFWKPWPQQGDSTYFEVAVVTDDGFRFEFHHINRSTLPRKIVDMLNAGGGRVEVGTEVGAAISWMGQDYDHIHYNIVAPSGVRINPEHASALLTDTMAPEISDAAVVSANGTVSSFGTGRLSEVPSAIVVAVQDHLDHNVYDHPPTFARLTFANGMQSSWDFTEKLTRADGSFPPLWDFFVNSVRIPGGRRLATTGGYGTGVSVIRLSVPAGAKGAFVLELGDQAGNVSRLTGSTP